MPPDCGFAERRDEGAVGVTLLGGDTRRQWLRAGPDQERRNAGCGRAEIGRRKAEIGLPGADQLDIDLGQELGVEQSAVLDPLGIVDPVARAEVVEPVRAAGKLNAWLSAQTNWPGFS